MLGLPVDEALGLLTALLTENMKIKKIIEEANQAIKAATEKTHPGVSLAQHVWDEQLKKKEEEAEKAAKFLEVLQGS